MCPVHVNQKHSTFQLIGATASMTEPCPSILAHARTLLSTATAATTTLKCRQLRPMLLSAALNIDSPGSHRDGFFPKHVLWLNAGVLFVNVTGRGIIAASLLPEEFCVPGRGNGKSKAESQFGALNFQQNTERSPFPIESLAKANEDLQEELERAVCEV